MPDVDRREIREREGWLTYALRRDRLLTLWISGHVCANKIPELLQHFARFGVASHFFLGEQNLVIHFELENALATHNKPVLFDDMLIISKDVLRHTDGSGGIVSRDTVFE